MYTMPNTHKNVHHRIDYKIKYKKNKNNLNANLSKMVRLSYIHRLKCKYRIQLYANKIK